MAVGEKHSIALSTWCTAPRPFLASEQETATPNPALLRAASGVASLTGSTGDEDVWPESSKLQWDGPQSDKYWEAIELEVQRSKPECVEEYFDASFRCL